MSQLLYSLSDCLPLGNSGSLCSEDDGTARHYHQHGASRCDAHPELPTLFNFSRWLRRRSRFVLSERVQVDCF
jgi:hypothetical protein